MPRRDFKTPFAVSGDQTQIPTDIQPDGSVSIIQGYGPDYQRPTDGSDPLAKVIERNKFNGLMNDVTASIGEVQLYGYAIWSAGMAPYPVEAYVRHADKVWKNTVANNTAEPGSGSTGSGGAGGSPGGQWGGDAQIAGTGGNGGNGGNGPFGTGGGGGRAGISSGTTSPGTIAFGYGVGGAGGGANYSSVSSRSGAQGLAGMPGFLLIEW